MKISQQILVSPYINSKFKINGVSFKALYTFNDKNIKYDLNVDDNNNSLTIKKSVNGKQCEPGKRFEEFAMAVHKIGLLPKFSEIYRKFRFSDLAGNISNIKQNLDYDELSEYMRLMNLPNRKTLEHYLSSEEIINAIRAKADEKLIIGKFNEIDSKTADKIKGHILGFSINSNTGGISGSHNYEAFEKIYKMASTQQEKFIDVTDILNCSDQNISAYAVMSPKAQGILYIKLSSFGELYAIKSHAPEGVMFRKYIVVELGNTPEETPKINFYLSIKKGSQAEKMAEDSFALEEKGNVSRGSGYKSITLLNKKHSIKNFPSKLIEPNTILQHYSFDKRDCEVITKRTIEPNGEKKYELIYGTKIPIESIRMNMDRQYAQISEKHFNAVIFRWLKRLPNSPKNGIVRLNKNAIKIYLDKLSDDESSDNIFDTTDKDCSIGIGEETYAIYRKEYQNGICVYKYAYGLDTVKKVMGKTKTLAPPNLINAALKFMSDNKFNALYKIDNNGRIFAYLKFNGIPFKLILSSKDTPTFFPVFEDDLKTEIGNDIHNIPEYTVFK